MRPVRYALLVAATLTGASAVAQDAGTNEPVTEVALIEVSDWRPVFGAVESVKRAEARARIAGDLKALSVTEGDVVAAGQEIARITDDKIPLEIAALDAGLLALDAQSAQAAIDLSRAEELRARGAVSAAALDEARTAMSVIEQTRAARSAERAVLETRVAEGAVLAPEAGRVLRVPVVQGMAVQPGEAIAEIAVEDFILRARLPERHAAFMAEGDPVRIAGRGMLSSPAGALGDGAAQGSIARIYPELEGGQVVVDIAAEGLGDFFVGERIRIDVATGRRPAVIVAPRYLDRRHGVTFARLEGAGEIVVQPGGQAGDGVEILAGLKPGDRLIAYGN